MRHHTIAATVAIGWGLYWMTGSSGGAGYYPTESACKVAAQQAVAANKSAAEKLAAEGAADQEANPKATHQIVKIEEEPIEWKCTEDPATKP